MLYEVRKKKYLVALVLSALLMGAACAADSSESELPESLESAETVAQTPAEQTPVGPQSDEDEPPAADPGEELPPPDPDASLHIILECVEEVEDGYVAYFGYLNDHPQTLNIPVGENNKFNPDPIDRGQVTSFLNGRHEDMFTVSFEEGNQVWSVVDPIRGSRRTATASENSKRCEN